MMVYLGFLGQESACLFLQVHLEALRMCGGWLWDVSEQGVSDFTEGQSRVSNCYHHQASNARRRLVLSVAEF